MAEDRRMTAAQVVDKLMSNEHVDVVRESVAWLVGELMEAEVAAQIGAELGQVSPERVTHLVLIGASGLYVSGEHIGDIFMNSQANHGRLVS